MLRQIILVSALLGAVVAVAADDPVAERKQLMKGNGKVTKDMVGMLRGQAPFDMAAVTEALKVYANTAEKAPALWPDSTKGAKSATLPEAFEKKQDFEERFKKFGTDVKAAQGTIKDEASFKSDMKVVLKNCNSCHELYRAKES